MEQPRLVTPEAVVLSFETAGLGSRVLAALIDLLIQGGILFLAFVFVLVNLVVDISYAVINPRIRYS